MRRAVIFLLAAAAHAQQSLAPTPAQVGPARGEDKGDYNIVNSFETGYRWSDVHGSLGKYRSEVNFRNGFRLLGSNLSINSRDGHGRYFDEILLNTTGLGNDPYESASLRVQKNGLYRYDMLWRMNEYFNPGLAVAQGQHLMDTRRRLQDHDLVVFPQSKLKFRFGYSRNDQTGPALTTFQFQSHRGDEFPLFADIRRERNEYRIGGDWQLLGFRLNWLHRWDYYKEDTANFLGSSTAGNNPFDTTSLQQFRRAEPYHGASPGWLVNLRREGRVWMANARFSYVGGRRDFVLDESLAGIDQFADPVRRQIVVGGNARRPVTAGDFSVSFFPGGRLTVTNNTSIHSTRIDGDARYVEFNQATLSDQFVNFQFLGIRNVANTTDVQFRLARRAGLYAGYQFSNREIRSVEQLAFPDTPADTVRATQENTTHAGLFGIRLSPAKPFSINLDAEVARAGRPFFPISDRNYHALGARAQYRTRRLTAGAGYRQNYNTNSVAISTHSSRARNYNADLSWTPKDWFAVDAGYAKLHLDTASGLAFFAGAPRPALVRDRQSLYFSNIHSGNLGARFGIGKRTDLYFGYSINRDTGDGRGAPFLGITDQVSAVLIPVQTFPVRYESPLLRVSVRLRGKMRWNAGYQFYRYREEFGVVAPFQNYRAHTGYSSVLWSF